MTAELVLLIILSIFTLDFILERILDVLKNITSKGFVRSQYKEKLVDLTNVRLNIKSKTAI